VNRRLGRLLLRLYPRDWRDRYGREVTALADDLVAGGDTTPRRAALDLATGAVTERGRVLLHGGRLLAPTVVLLAAAAAPLLVARPPRTGLPLPYFSTHAGAGLPLLMIVLAWLLVESMMVVHARQTPEWLSWRRNAVTVRMRGARVTGLACTLAANGWLYFAPALVPAAAIRDAAASAGIGIGLVSAGIVLRLWALATRTPYLANTLRISPDQPVTTTGPYRLIRQPQYAGILLLCAGYGAASGNWVGLAAMTLLPLAVVVRRIRVEERVLAATVGERYAGYAVRHRALLPGVW
jgi:protein-S-isoprenylcysteine O-methyltransferase Ste14